MRLSVGGTLRVDGVVSANGGAGGGYYPGGGGAGGSIELTVGTLDGSGVIAANGGEGPVGPVGSAYTAGGGGGGRIAVYYQSKTFSGTLTALGGAGHEYGGAGTIYTKAPGQTYGDLLVDNGGRAGATTALVDAAYTFDHVTVVNGGNLEVPAGTLMRVASGDVTLATGTVTLNGSASVPNLHIASGGLVTHAAGQSGFDLTVTGDLTVESAGAISADGKGYAAQQGPGSGTSLGGGAGYGGAGGGSSGGGAGGGTYCPTALQVELGSGGRNWSNTGGAGGGALRVTVGGTLLVDGDISANGADGPSSAGGGSGGSIYLTAGSIAGSGVISADGGNGIGNTGGGGGGGRIYLDYVSYAFSGLLSASGGSGYHPGEAGSIYTLPEAIPLQLNKQVTVHLTGTPCVPQVWGFTGVAAQQVRLKDIHASTGGIAFDLTAPDGTTLFTGVTDELELTNLPISGLYKLTARDTNATTDRTYTFTLEETAVTDLTLSNVYNGSFVGSGQAQLFKIEMPDGGPMRIVLDDGASSNFVEIYVKFGSAPTRGSYDYRFTVPASSDQHIFIPIATPGTWYVLVYGDTINTPNNYTLLLQSAPVLLESVSPSYYGIGADAVLTLTGGGLDQVTRVELVGSMGTRYAADSIEIDSPTQIQATFVAGSVPARTYSVVVFASDGTLDQLSNAFEMTQSKGGKLNTNLIVPSPIGYHSPSTIWIEYTNEGDVAIPAPLLVVTATQNGRPGAIMGLSATLAAGAFWTSATLPQGYSNTVQFLASGSTPGLLQPGETFRVPVQYAGWQLPWDSLYRPINFSLGVLRADNTTLVDWTSYRDQMRPASISSEAWAPIWANFVARTGATWGDYVAMLDKNLAYLGRLGEKVTDISDLLAFEFAQAHALNVVRSVAAATDAYATAPGLDLRFSRVFPQSIVQHYALGAVGRGWSHNWHMSLQASADGTVTVLEPGGGRRIFQPDSRPGRGYFAMDGDHGTVTTLGGGAFSLRETTGLATVFRTDGKLDYVEDTNGNRVTASYNGNQLIRLSHSAGQALQLTYNASGRIAAITDPNGRQTSYTYDAYGEHLQTVAYFDGSTIQYAYSTGAGSAREHALTQIAFPGGTHQYFAYDDRGRLATVSRDGGAEALSFAYDNAGMVALLDAFNNRSEFYLDNHGLVVKAKDPQGDATHLTWDQQFNLTGFTDPASRAYQYAYDEKGNLIRSVDPLGNATGFAYSGPFDRMTALTDANGNRTSYAYDSAGDLTSITDADSSVERWAYDASGNASSWTNRRANAIAYEHDSAGRLTAKVLPGNVRVEYHYDARGNLTSTVDPTGTTTLEYDTSDRLTKITYPGDRWLAYAYNTASQRASSLNQLGDRLDYHYDAVGHLERMTDETGEKIVRYIYDAAGRLQRKNLGNGVYTLYGYDSASQLTSLINYKPNASVLSQFLYAYDTRGWRTSMTTLEGQWSYTYDDLGQLTGWTAPDGRHVEYKYDPLGNRITVTDNGTATPYATNNLNEYTLVGNATYQYDADGNLTHKISPAGTTTYTYNEENRLVAVSAPGGNWLYTYDAFGSRVRVDDNGAVSDFVVDPIGLGNMVGEYDHGSGVQNAAYDHGIGLLSRTDGSGAKGFYTFDAVGSTSEITGALGSTGSAYSYLPFGESPAQQQSSDDPFTYVGEYGVMKDKTDLYLMRARHYSSTLGRFASRDPIGIAGGDINLNRYVHNWPTMAIDPVGELDPGEFHPQYENPIKDPPKGPERTLDGRVVIVPSICSQYPFLCEGDVCAQYPGFCKPALILLPLSPNEATQAKQSVTVAPSDPNGKTGPAGYGAQRLLV